MSHKPKLCVRNALERKIAGLGLARILKELITAMRVHIEAETVKGLALSLTQFSG